MKIEKLTENKIRITLNLDDLDENNVDFHSFMANSPQSQDFFCTVLDKAENEVGFVTKDYKLMIEAIAVPEGNFILTITRMKQENTVSSISKKIQVKRKDTKIEGKILIYKFITFDDFCEFGNYIRLNAPAIAKKLKNTKLYIYKSNYYFVVNNSNMHIEQLKIMHYMLLEFSELVHNGKLFQSTLNEYGKLIIRQNPLNLINKYFTK